MIKTSVDFNRHQRTSPLLTICHCIPSPTTPLDRVEKRKDKQNLEHKHIITIQQTYKIKISDIYLLLILFFWSAVDIFEVPSSFAPSPPSSLLPSLMTMEHTLNTKLWEPSLTTSSNNCSLLNNNKYVLFSFLSSHLSLLMLSCICISITDRIIQDLSVIRREVKEHFERCMHALEARQHSISVSRCVHLSHLLSHIFLVYSTSHLSPLTSLTSLISHHLSPLTLPFRTIHSCNINDHSIYIFQQSSRA